MMTSEILKSADFTKAGKSKYLEKEALIFLQIKNYFYLKGYFMAKIVFWRDWYCKKHVTFSKKILIK